MTRQHEMFAERALLTLHQEAFEAGMEMQMTAMEMSARWATELGGFMARQAQANSERINRISAVSTADELANVQLDLTRNVIQDCAGEAGRLLDITEQVTREAAAGARSILRDYRQQ